MSGASSGAVPDQVCAEGIEKVAVRLARLKEMSLPMMAGEG